MPFIVNNECLDTTAKALLAFQSNYPQQQAGVVYSLTSSSINASGLLTFSVRNNSGSTVINNGTAQLTSCTTPSSFVPDFNNYLASMLVVFFFAFFLRKAIRFFSRFIGGFSSDL